MNWPAPAWRPSNRDPQSLRRGPAPRWRSGLASLAFHHPTAGTQLVKGTVNPGETPLKAAARALWEETGLTVRAGLLLGHSTGIVPGEDWHFALLRPAPPVPDRWSHQTRDDHGHVFHCVWQTLDAPHSFEDHFDRAWQAIRQWLA